MSNEATSNKEYIGNELELFALAKNWKRYWSSKIQPLLGTSVLEVGAGIGGNLFLLKQRHQQWTALEPDATQATTITNQCAKTVDDDEVEVVVGTLSSIKCDRQFDSIIYIDVLEHIEKDKSEVSQAFSHLKVGGRLIILAPAHQALFSPFDKSVGHYRRYDKNLFRGLKPKNAGIESLFYLDSVGCIVSWCNAKLLKSRMPTKSQIWFWDTLMIPASKVLDCLTGHRVGKTIVVVFQKP